MPNSLTTDLRRAPVIWRHGWERWGEGYLGSPAPLDPAVVAIVVALASGSGGGVLCMAAGSIGYIACAERGGEARGHSSGVYFVRGEGWHGVSTDTYTVESATSGGRVRHASTARRSGGDERGRCTRRTLGARLIPTVLHGGRVRGA